MPWWEQTYLNEGFARYYEFVGSEAAHPEYYFWTQVCPRALKFPSFGNRLLLSFFLLVFQSSESFYSYAYGAAMAADQFGLAPAVIRQPGEISGSVASVHNGFGIITYGKGASLN